MALNEPNKISIEKNSEKKNINNRKKGSQGSQITSLQNKIKEQAKRLYSMQEYITVLESKLNLNNNNNINNLEEQNSQEYINRLKSEKEEILSQLKQEIITNDEQRNYIEILKQALESNIAKHGLTEKINFLQKKYYKDNKTGDIANIILDISKLKENNDILKKEKNELNTEKEKLKNDLNSYNKLNNEYNILIESNNELQSEYYKLKNLYSEKEKDVIDLKEKYIKSERKNEFLSNENNTLRTLRKDNMDLAKSVSDMGIKINKLTLDNNNLKDYQTRYDILMRENCELKKINQSLTDDNISIQNKLNSINNYLQDLEIMEKENQELKQNLENYKKNIEEIKNEKKNCENIYLDKIKNLTQEKNNYENFVNEKKIFYEEENKNKIKSYMNDNKKLYDFNKKLAEDNQKFLINHKFMTKLIYRILKFHIPNLNAKNIICEMINLNEKKIENEVNIKKYEKNLEKILGRNDINFEEKAKIENNIVNLKNDLNIFEKKLIKLEEELKEYEI